MVHKNSPSSTVKSLHLGNGHYTENKWALMRLFVFSFVR